MKDTVATASRDLFQIKKRKYSHYAYRGLQIVARTLTDESSGTVLLYPAVTKISTLANLLNRLGWYLPERTLREDVEILIPTELDHEDAYNYDEDSQLDYRSDHLPISRIHSDSAEEAAGKADSILLWDAASRLDPALLRNLTKVEIVDPTYYSGVEPHRWGTFTDDLREPVTGLGSEAFRELENTEYDQSYVFATGPSLSRAWEFEFEDDSLKVVCNSIVKNDELLEHIDPDVLVFADPVFHFGPSRYAGKFRKDAVDAVRKHDCLAVVPSRYLSLLSGHFPEINVVGLTSVDADDPVFPTHDEPSVMSTGNIMTWFMLPIASSFTDEVNILGADGREEDESYFWEHNEDAQYDDELMRTAVDCHPSFFRDRVYTDYYEEHCQTLASFLEYGESRGVEYRTLTDSHVDCLQKRTSPETKPMVE